MRSLLCAGCSAELPLTSEREPGVLVCAECEHEHRASTAPPPPPNPSAEFQVGDDVLVLWGERWWPARVERVVAEDIWQVHYEGWPAERDEIVNVARVRARVAAGRPLSPRVFGALVTLASVVGVGVGAWALGVPDVVPERVPTTVTDRGPITPTGLPVPTGLRIPPGTPLEVQWNDSFYRAVTKVHYGDGSLSVHYVGWSDAFDGEVDEADARISEAAIATARGPVEGSGAPVMVDSPVYSGDVLEVAWRDGFYRAVVLETYPDGRLRVHYAGWGDDLDEDIPRERARRVLAADDALPE
ncbi:MAG: hypothetical protein H6725_22640 [Sandaracinaceae bacterium]|nr:hypothetical protein [Sandaracinaceae bacterium]